ncbi:HAMP domain-containing sensor histidine kinase [Natrialba sp. INN-245]|uniref:ATP-binding protein n=1 Tax=Natrialba sp. INN-245 TaxID=2690967 RepID=UPI001F20BCD2|nr:HAMP domain-containing sensor histidine kinase [Natrialba sp. INN-245]
MALRRDGGHRTRRDVPRRVDDRGRRRSALTAIREPVSQRRRTGSTSPRSQTPEDAVEHGSTSHAGADGSADAVEHGAGDSTDESGERTVRVGWDEGVLFVEDDGPGIPADERENVFDHGYTTSADGTGFGLAIVEAIADAHGWAIDVGEGIDGGARFEIRGISVGSRP